MTPKKRGRPVGQKTLEKLRLEKFMHEAPEHIKINKLTAEEIAELEESFKQNEKIRCATLKIYRHGPGTPDEHVYNMASLGDESFEGYEQKVLDDDVRYRQIAKKIRTAGGAESKRKAEIRQRKVMKINMTLIEKLYNRTYNTHQVATMINKQWESMTPAHRLVGEDRSMTCRGDGGKPVSVRTVERWLEQHLSTFDKPRGKKIPRS